MYETENEKLARQQPKTRDGHPMVNGETYYTKEGFETIVKMVPVFDRTVNDGGYYRTCTGADVYKENPKSS